MMARKELRHALPSSLVTCVLMLAALPPPAAADDARFVLSVRNGRFSPAQVRVPAGQKIMLIVDNVGDAIEEFESFDLDREKVIPPKSQATIFVGPLKPGRYEFIDEFNLKMPPGVLIVE